MDDQTLLNRARRGDEAAFSRLFAEHQRSIYRYAVYMCGADAGDDIVQDTFLAVLRQSGRHDAPEQTVSGYLFGIARHLVMKRFGQQGREATATFDDAAIERVTTNDPSALDAFARLETIEAVRVAVHSLPSAYREAVVLCELQEMSYDDAAGLMECPVGTVRSRLHRARALLLTKLAAAAGVGA